ncbi:hypothetical protein KC324_g10816, partial [Hortaea werneckii]
NVTTTASTQPGPSKSYPGHGGGKGSETQGPSKTYPGHGGGETTTKTTEVVVTLTSTYPVTTSETHSVTYSYPISSGGYHTTHATTVITQTHLTTAVMTYTQGKPSKTPYGPGYTSKPEGHTSAPGPSNGPTTMPVGPVTTATGYTCPPAETMTMKVPAGSTCECPAAPQATLTITETVWYGSMSAGPTYGGHSSSAPMSSKSPMYPYPSSSMSGGYNNGTMNGTSYGPTAYPTASTTYACNPAHQYPAGQVCTTISGSLTLITTTGSSMPTASASMPPNYGATTTTAPATTSATWEGGPAKYSTDEAAKPTGYWS